MRKRVRTSANSLEYPDFESHYLCLHNFAQHGRTTDFSSCVGFVRRGIPCGISADQADGTGVNWAATMLLGRRAATWDSDKMSSLMDLLGIYIDAGYIPAGQFLAPIAGAASSADIHPYNKRASRLPLAAALYVGNARAAVLLLDRGDLAVNDLRTQYEQFLDHRNSMDGVRTAVLPPVASRLEVACEYIRLLFDGKPAELAMLTGALMRCQIRSTADSISGSWDLADPIGAVATEQLGARPAPAPLRRRAKP